MNQNTLKTMALKIKNLGVDIPAGFRGIIYEPSNEQETIALFLLLMNRIKPSWCILRIQKAYPDAVFYDISTRREIRIEFEYLASHFRHDEKDCDMIVCWGNDLGKKADKMKIEILSLRDEISRISINDIYLGYKQDGTIDKALQEGIKNRNRIAIAVDKFVNVEIPKLEKQYSSLFLDRNQKKHYVLRWEGKGIFGIYPSGRLIAGSVNKYVNNFGKKISDAGTRFRDSVKNKIKGLNIRSKESTKVLDVRSETLKKAIVRFCKKLTSI